MKKFIAIVLTLICIFGVVGCSNRKENTTTAYSFHGEDENFTITHGEIVLGDKEEEFSGGDIEYRPDLFDDVKSYATTFYTLKDGEKNVILSNSIDDQAGISIQVETNLGKISGPNIISESVEKIDDIEENLWFELTIKYKNGEEKTYPLQLSVIK